MGRGLLVRRSMIGKVSISMWNTFFVVKRVEWDKGIGNVLALRLKLNVLTY